MEKAMSFIRVLTRRPIYVLDLTTVWRFDMVYKYITHVCIKDIYIYKYIISIDLNNLYFVLFINTDKLDEAVFYVFLC